jgi:hypothetical protein
MLENNKGSCFRILADRLKEDGGMVLMVYAK